MAANSCLTCCIPSSAGLYAPIFISFFLMMPPASCLVQAQVFRKGEILYVRDQRQLAEFRMKSMAMIADFTPYAMMIQRGLKNRMGNAHG